MKKINMKTLRSYGPCYDPSRYLKESWRGTVLDIVKNKDIPFADRLWVIMRKELVSEKLMRLFAVWCARKALKYNDNPVLVDVLKVVTRYIKGKATTEELSAAESAAWSAAVSAARSAAVSAAESAAGSAAESAAGSAAGSAAESAARSAAESAAWSAARSAAWSAQEKQLIKMLKAGVKTKDVL
jgi:activator of HSP90 ATPase